MAIGNNTFGFQINDVSYSGTYSDYLLMPAIAGADSVNKGAVAVIDNIKKQHTIARLQYDTPLVQNMANPVPQNPNGFQLDGRLIVPQDVDIYEEFNPRDLEQNQYAQLLQNMILDRPVPNELQAKMVKILMEQAMNYYDKGIWMGCYNYFSSQPAGTYKSQLQFFNGLIYQMLNDPGVQLSNYGSGPVTLTSSNILAVLDSLIQQVSTSTARALVGSIEHRKYMKFGMSYKTYQIFSQALRTGLTFKGTAIDLGAKPSYGGYDIIEINGMPDDTIVFCKMDSTPGIGANLYAGMNSWADWTVKSGPVSNTGERFFILAKFKWGVQYGWSNETFLYTTLTKASFTN